MMLVLLNEFMITFSSSPIDLRELRNIQLIIKSLSILDSFPLQAFSRADEPDKKKESKKKLLKQKAQASREGGM